VLIAGALAIAALAVVSVPAVVSWYPALLVIALVYSVTANSLPAVLDGWLMARREENPRINYGIARGLGSAGFAVGAVTIGLVAERLGITVIFPIYLGIVGVTALLVLQIPRVHRHSSEATSPTEASAGHAKAILSNRPYLLLLVSTFFAFVGLRAGLTFLPILVEELNGAVSDVGFAHSVAALSEIPFLFLSGWIFLRWRGVGLIVFLLALLSVRLVGYTLLSAIPELFVLQTSHGLTFGLFLAATVDYIHRIAPPEHRSFFQALAPSVYFGLGSISGSWLGGLVIERFSVDVMYRGAALSALLGSTVLLLGSTIGRRWTQRRART
jgi:predicted MFS family arabinose efflux permease